MSQAVEAGVPFRWDLVTPDHLGSLLDGTDPPDLWFLGELVRCAGTVVARGGGGELVFVGRSLDSMFDLLSGAMHGVPGGLRCSRLPFSFARPAVRRGSRWRRPPLTPAQVGAARRVLAGLALTPYALARRSRPVAFVDVVHGGDTFTELFGVLRGWVDRDREPWPVIRRKVRFVGVTTRRKSSPNTFRWQQHAQWTRHLPAGAVCNVSLHPWVWSYLGDQQVKLTRSFTPNRWLAEADGPGREEKTRQALAEAAALVAHGRSPHGRQALVRAMEREPALDQSWLRTLIGHLHRTGSADAD